MSTKNATTFKPRAVHVSWDNGAQEIDGIIRASTEHGILINPLFDLTLLPGVVWIRRDCIEALLRYPKSSLEHRASLRRGYLDDWLPPQLTDASSLVARLHSDHELVMMFQEATGSGVGKVGWIEDVKRSSVRLTVVDRAAKVRKQGARIKVSDLISVVWGDYYLSALSEMIAAKG